MANLPSGGPDRGGSPAAPVRIPRRAASLANLQTRVEIEEGRSHFEVVYTSPIWAQVSLPNSDQKDATLWTRKNGALAMTVQAGAGPDETGRMVQKPLPFGVIPRQALVYMVTYAVRNGERTIPLGDSMHDFMRTVGLADGGQNRRNVIKQMEALALSRISVSTYEQGADGSWGYQLRQLPVTEGLDLWVNGKSDTPGLWGSTAILAPKFFASIIEGKDAMPVYLEDLRHLKGSPLRFDLYLWLVYRLWSLRKLTRVTWVQLHDQFGQGYARQLDFKKAFKLALTDVLGVYRDANVTVTDLGIELRHSKRHVAAIDRR
ncbi:replication protein RepA [Rathayibacter rathayi]|uniref:replication protein RepA n=1 Tax=Rathayibacter rathayi TaxID=33887 RepID=UPI000CE72276|nr:replication protein RepA [Rathayibacter rathayi]PPH29280.1 hypothetical protein C5C28_14980 [Rathayibacter rathayi]